MASKEEQEDEQMAPKPESEQVPSASKTESEAGPAAMLVEATADAALLQQLDTELKCQVQPENFREVLLRVCDLLLDHHGGPVQYLQSELGAEPNAAWTAFAADLERRFPRRPDLTYVDGLQYPAGCQGQASAIKLSLWQLGWHPDCSSKPPTFKPAARKLVDEFLTHSFITASDNLLLYQSESYPGRMENQQGAPIFFTHYVKGAARASTILMLAHVLVCKMDLDVASLNPRLYDSMLAVFCKESDIPTDAVAIALENATLSARGDIRKQHDVITWLSKLLILKGKGLSPTEVLQRWNESATREAAVVGNKRTGLLLLLKLPTESAQLLLKHSSTFGNDSAFSNEVFAHKRLHPGYTPRGMPRQWQTRMTVTVDGFNLFVQYVHASQARKIKDNRKNWDKSALEETLSMAQLLTSLMVEIQNQHAVHKDLLLEKVIHPFLDFDPNFELELQSALSECKADFQPADLSKFKDVVAVALANRDSKMTAIGQGPRITAGELEKQAFEVMLASAEHDVQSYRAWRTKCLDRDSAQYFQQLQHTARRQKQAKEIAASVTAAGPTWQIQLDIFKKLDTANFAIVTAIADKIQRLHQLSDRESIHCIAFLNWSAPAIFSAQTQKAQAGLCGGIVNGLGRSIGVCLSPIHFYKRGSLHKAEQNCLTLLTNSALNTDTRFAVAYASKTDEREKRPMLHPGFILFPGGTDESAAHKVLWQIWRTSGLLSKGAITDVSMNPSQQMHVIEDMRDDALPDSSDTATHLSQVEKAVQIGEDAARKVLQAALPQGLSRAAILVVDLSSHTLELAKACYKERVAKTQQTPIYYLGMAESESELEWQRHHLESWLSEGYIDGSIGLPPGAPSLMPKELPSDVVTALPPKPDLNTLAWSAKKDEVAGLPTLKTPDKILQAWHDHAVYGSRFQEWLTQSRAAIPLDLSESASTKASSSSNKRGAPGTSESLEPPPKVLKSTTKEEDAAAAAAAASIPAADLPKPLAWQATISGSGTKGKSSGGGKLVIAVGKRVFIVNEGSADLLLQPGSTLAGYYKGKFVALKSGQEEARLADVPFTLTDSTDSVLHENKIQSVGQVVAQKRALTPLSASVCYHELVDQPNAEDAKHFILTLKSPIAFRPENAPTTEDKKDKDGCYTLPQTSMAGCLDTLAWETKHTSITWAVKWQARGLQPVRPVVVVTRKLTVKAGQAVELVK